MAARDAAHPVLRLLPGRDARVKGGFPWIYSNEVAMDAVARTIEPGTVVRVISDHGRQLGLAGFNRHTLIAARMLSRDPDDRIDGDFVAARLHRALGLRDRLYDRPYYRLVHAEADGLPGTIIDRYGDAIAVQCNTALMDRLTPELVDALERLLEPRAIVLRNDSGGRALEGLSSEVSVARGTLDGPVALEENGARFLADLVGGQKTGWFYDQRDNRAFAARLAKGLDVLDVYCHTGGFAIAAARAGARHVLAVDRSQPALALAQEAAGANGCGDRMDWRRAEAFGELERLARDGDRFGLVIVDPPAFVKTKRDLAVGSRGYRKLARLAAAVVAPGGFLVACSCSHHVDPALFAEQVRRGLVDARRTGRILMASGAAPDHPVHPCLPETAYLKALALQLD
ncbi:MAG: class I SAM-dependent rRNA methyltransferase [Rhodospirillaceae bacterium]|nr:class I SAM-dependent rRNA methyltransferase [Rhodospirillaceae bacterium]